jgi:hypothetical protein
MEITNPPANIVFLTDCKSLLESLITSRDSHAIMHDIISELNLLRESTQVALQWIPSHCGIDSNEMADSLSRVGSCLAQYEHLVNFCEAKTIIRNRRRTEWRHRLQIDNNLDPIVLWPRRAKTSIFRLRTGHCRLRAHLHRLNSQR